jgi:hypothetical protein
MLFHAGLWKLGGLVLHDSDVLFLNGGRRWCSANGRVETRKGTRVE